MKRVMKTKAHTSGLNTRTKTRRKQLKGGGGAGPKAKGKKFYISRKQEKDKICLSRKFRDYIPMNSRILSPFFVNALTAMFCALGFA